MMPETENAIRSVAKEVIAEFRSKSNQHSYRELLDKHCVKISALCPPRFPAWQWLNAFVYRVSENKE